MNNNSMMGSNGAAKPVLTFVSAMADAGTVWTCGCSLLMQMMQSPLFSGSVPQRSCSTELLTACRSAYLKK